MNIEQSQKEFMESVDRCTHECEEGRKCTCGPIEFAGPEPYRLIDLAVVVLILLILGYIAFRPELTGLVMAIGEMI